MHCWENSKHGLVVKHGSRACALGNACCPTGGLGHARFYLLLALCVLTFQIHEPKHVQPKVQRA